MQPVECGKFVLMQIEKGAGQEIKEPVPKTQRLPDMLFLKKTTDIGNRA